MNYQKIIIVGNATRAARGQKSKKSDTAYASFGLAVSDSKDRVVFFHINVFGKLAAVAENYVSKGSQVLIEGRVDVGTNGRFNIIADRILLGSPTKS